MTREPLDLRGINFEEGYIAVLDKPLRWTSTDVVRKVKFTLRKLGYRKIKVGHAGTLDPLATGILVVCIGRATKLVDALQAEEKEYIADVMLGATTPSYDLEHEIDRTYPYEHITREAVEEALASLTGERLQTPPVYSAKKIDGTRAYELARAGEEVAVRQALINIYEMEIVEYDLPRVRIRVVAARAPTSGRWPTRSGRRCTAEPISRRCAARAAADSRSKKRTNWMIFWKICKNSKQNSLFYV